MKAKQNFDDLFKFRSFFSTPPPAVMLDCLSCLVVTFGWCIRTVLLSVEICLEHLANHKKNPKVRLQLFIHLSSPHSDDDASTIDAQNTVKDKRRKRKRKTMFSYFLLLKYYLKQIWLISRRTLISFLKRLKKPGTKDCLKDWLETILRKLVHWMQCLEANDVSCCRPLLLVFRPSTTNAMFLWLITPFAVNSLIEISSSFSREDNTGTT